MSWINRLLNIVRSNRHSRELDRELEFHLEECIDDLVASGVPRAHAVREARRRFGNYGSQKERTRDADIVTWLDVLISDLRYALRGLRHSPGFAFVAIASLALGIGANTAIFTLVDAVILRTLPVSHPEELVQIRMREAGGYFTNPMWEQIRDHQTMMAGVFAYSDTRFNLASGGEARFISGDMVSGNYFRTLGVRPQLGRLLTVADDQRGCSPTLVLSDGYWQTQYGSDPNVVGKTISLNSHPFRIIGIAQPGFTGLEVGHATQVFVPICSELVLRGKSSSLDHRSLWWLRLVGRPKTGLSRDQVGSALGVMSPGVFAATLPPKWRADDQSRYLKNVLEIAPAGKGMSELRHRYTRALVTLMVIVGLVLVIACANVANLLLARAAARRQETAVRVALGAARGRLVRQHLTESLLLSVAGTLAGLAFALWGSRMLVRYISTTATPIVLNLGIDGRLLGFNIALALLTGLAFGLAPAWRSSDVAPNEALKANARGIAGTRFIAGQALVVVQIAISLTLVTGAGLLLGTFRKLATLDIGFKPDSVLIVTVTQRGGASRGVDRLAIDHQLLAEFGALPGVTSASMSQITPMGSSMWNEELVVDGFTPKSQQDEIAFFNEVSPDYFATLRTPILAGRDFNAKDNTGSALVAIVNESMAKHFYNTTAVVGKTFKRRVDKTTDGPFEIVGVVKDAKYQTVREETLPTAYLPVAQDSTVGAGMSFELRVAGGPLTIVPAVKRVLSGVNPNFSVTFKSFATQVNNSLARERVLATLSGFFGALALLLAMLGLYGVMSYNVARRRNEIGIRMALGAGRRRVTTMVLRQVSTMVAVGLALGLTLAVAMTRLISSFLFGLTPRDPATLAASMALLAGVALAAAYLPARRAARVDPMDTLREQ